MMGIKKTTEVRCDHCKQEPQYTFHRLSHELMPVENYRLAIALSDDLIFCGSDCFRKYMETK